MNLKSTKIRFKANPKNVGIGGIKGAKSALGETMKTSSLTDFYMYKEAAAKQGFEAAYKALTKGMKPLWSGKKKFTNKLKGSGDVVGDAWSKLKPWQQATTVAVPAVAGTALLASGGNN